jgi:hypothetical protein
MLSGMFCSLNPICDGSFTKDCEVPVLLAWNIAEVWDTENAGLLCSVDVIWEETSAEAFVDSKPLLLLIPCEGRGTSTRVVIWLLEDDPIMLWDAILWVAVDWEASSWENWFWDAKGEAALAAVLSTGFRDVITLFIDGRLSRDFPDSWSRALLWSEVAGSWVKEALGEAAGSSLET